MDYFVGLLEDGKFVYKEDGSVWRLWELRRGWLLEPRRAEKVDPSGYFMLRTNPKPYGPLYVMAHRVIWTFCREPIPIGMEINHKNAVKNDNRLTNLEVVTRLENMQHATRLGLRKPQRGDNHPRTKLSDEAVRIIREEAEKGILQKELAARFGVSRVQISRVVSRIRRADVAVPEVQDEES